MDCPTHLMRLAVGDEDVSVVREDALSCAVARVASCAGEGWPGDIATHVRGLELRGSVALASPGSWSPLEGSRAVV